jgi:hypothetical protein
LTRGGVGSEQATTSLLTRGGVGSEQAMSSLLSGAGVGWDQPAWFAIGESLECGEMRMQCSIGFKTRLHPPNVRQCDFLREISASDFQGRFA